MTLRDLINEQLADMLKRKRLGKTWGLTKRHIAELAKIRLNLSVKPSEIAKAVKELQYRFLMKTPCGYCFPANAREWKQYTEARQKQARGLLHEAIDESSFNYNDFTQSLTNETIQTK